MEMFGSDVHQVFVKLLDGKHKILNFTNPSISVSTLKHRIQTLTSIPSHLQLLLSNDSRIINDDQTLNLDQIREDLKFSETLAPACSTQFPQIEGRGKFPVVVHLLLRLRGGKGGFGSLLRGAATKAGQKKTNNFDACRDMNGRRLRHVNAEKKLEEWRAEAEERKLEKMADEYIRKKTKEVVKSGKSNGVNSVDKYVLKYREDSAKCMKGIEKSVKESLKGLESSKRKSNGDGNESGSKRFKIWSGKRKIGDSESENDSDEDEEGENQKSVIIDSGNRSDSSKEAEGSSGSVTGGKLDATSLDQGSSGSGSEEEKDGGEESSRPGKSLDVSGNGDDGTDRSENAAPERLTVEKTIDQDGVDIKVNHESHSSKVEEIISQLPAVPSLEEGVSSAAEVSNCTIVEPVQEETVSVNVEVPDLGMPLNFDEYNSAAALEVLGLERLKAELQDRGLKCGGTLQERAARLFLLKTTPLEMLPKKLFAKK